MRWSLFIVERMERVSCWPWTSSMYVVLLCVTRFCYWYSMQQFLYHMRPHHVANFILVCHFSFQIYYTPGTINVNNGCVSIFVVGWMLNVCNGCCVDPGQADRAFVLLCVSDRIWRCYYAVWLSMRPSCTILKRVISLQQCSIVLISFPCDIQNYTAMTIDCDSTCINLRSWNVCNGAVLCRSWMNSAYVVRIVVYDLDLEAVIDVWCNMSRKFYWQSMQ